MKAIGRVAAAQFKSSPAVFAAPVTMVVGLWGVLYSFEPLWLGRWYDTELYVQSYAALIAGPVAAATAAIATAGSRRPGLTVVVAASIRGRFAELLMVWITAVVWSLGVVLVIQMAAWGRTWAASDFGLGVPWITMVTAAVVALEVALGVVVGATLPRFVAAALVTGGLYGFYYFHVRGDLSSAWRRYFPVVQEHWDPQYTPDVARLLVVGLFCFSVALLLLILATALSQARVPTAVLSVLLAMTALSGVVIGGWEVNSGGSLYSKMRSAEDIVCRTVDDGRVCVWTGDRAHLDSLAEGYAIASQSDGDLDLIPRELVQTGIPMAPGGVELLLAYAPASPESIGAAVIESSLPTPSGRCPHETSTRIDGRPWHHVFFAILFDRAGISRPSLGGKAEEYVRVAEALPWPQQSSWLNSAVSAYAECRVVPELP